MTIDLGWLRAQFPDLQNITILKGGGQKLVFSAQHPTEGDVVLKLIHPSQSAETVSREQLAVDQVQSPRVPRILGTGKLQTPLGACFWFREERVNGTPVRDLLQQGPLPPRKVLRLGLHTLEALVRAEAAKIVHRDIKPDNIMWTTGDDFWLLDFGIARHLDLISLTATSAHFGKFTPGYAPPEQFRNLKSDIDTRADLFALGVTIHEAASGRNEFRSGAANDLEVLNRIETVALPPLKVQMVSGSQFNNFVSALTQKRRDHRPPNAKEAFDWLHEICMKEKAL